jgi:YD repeat-containing protein
MSRLAILPLALAACVGAGDPEIDEANTCVVVMTNIAGTHEVTAVLDAPSQPRETRVSHDGVPQTRYTYEYDAAGRMTSQFSDDGERRLEHTATETVETFHISGAMVGDPVRYAIGSGDHVIRQDWGGGNRVYVLGAMDRLVRFDEAGVILDVGPYSSTTEYTYDELGRPKTKRTDNPRVGITDQMWSYESTPGTLVIVVERSSDPTPLRFTYRYDADHRLIAANLDTDSDGIDDVTHGVVYDAEGTATVTSTWIGSSSSTYTISTACGPLEAPVFRGAPSRPGPEWRFEMPQLPDPYL